MKMDTISIQGVGEWNEDALVMNESLRIYGVLDGATSLHPYRGAGGETGGYLASSCIRDYIEALTADADEAGGAALKDIVLRANKRLREDMIAAGVNMADKTALWTAALALVRIHEHNVDYVQAGDCMLAALYEDGAVRVLTRDHVAHIDLESKRLLEEGIQSGLTDRQQLRERVKPVILNNRNRMNTAGGYSVVSGEPELADFIECGTLNRINLKALLMVTDGLFYPEERGSGTGGMEAVVRSVAAHSLASYADWLLQLEREDSECLKYPRFKVSDDKTAVWIQFK